MILAHFCDPMLNTQMKNPSTKCYNHKKTANETTIQSRWHHKHLIDTYTVDSNETTAAPIHMPPGTKAMPSTDAGQIRRQPVIKIGCIHYFDEPPLYPEWNWMDIDCWYEHIDWIDNTCECTVDTFTNVNLINDGCCYSFLMLTHFGWICTSA